MKVGDEEKCLTSITAPCVHPHVCKAGPARLRPHRAVMTTCKHALRKAGAEVDLERALPYLYVVSPGGIVTKAILDVVVSIPGCISTVPIDVTIRCPHAVRNATGISTAAVLPAVAAREGELERLSRYDDTVVPLSLETYGRLGPNSETRMRQLTATIASSDVMSRFACGRDFLAHWRCEIERTLLWNMADIVLISFGHVSGINAARRGRIRE